MVTYFIEPFAPRQYSITPLPSGWEAKTDKTGRAYYIDHNSKKTQWTHPLEPITEMEAAKKIQHLWRKKKATIRVGNRASTTIVNSFSDDGYFTLRVTISIRQ